ncbi:MAG: T9SS type A sorting domain-containing protein [Chitinophagaceae bacterium]|nr:T9SS type A sorting domain-containing protein [Chitinophagaceae bacterium]
MCNGAMDYTLNGMPNGTPVQWESSNPAIATVTANGNPATVTKVSNGSIILTAKVKSDCGHFFSTTKQIQMLSAPASIGIVSLSNIEFCGDGSSFRVLPNVNNYGVFTVSSYSGTLTWSLPPYSISNKMSWYDEGNGKLRLSSKISNSSVTLRCTSTNSCGSTYKDYWFTTGDCPVALTIGNSTLNSNIENAQIFPNPSNGQFNISLNTNNAATAIQKIIIKNKMGITVYQQAFKNNQKIQTINLSDKPADIYTIQIFDGRKWITERLRLNK